MADGLWHVRMVAVGVATYGGAISAQILLACFLDAWACTASTPAMSHGYVVAGSVVLALLGGLGGVTYALFAFAIRKLSLQSTSAILAIGAVSGAAPLLAHLLWVNLQLESGSFAPPAAFEVMGVTSGVVMASSILAARR